MRFVQLFGVYGGVILVRNPVDFPEFVASVEASGETQGRKGQVGKWPLSLYVSQSGKMHLHTVISFIYRPKRSQY